MSSIPGITPGGDPFFKKISKTFPTPLFRLRRNRCVAQPSGERRKLAPLKQPALFIPLVLRYSLKGAKGRGPTDRFSRFGIYRA